MLRFALRALARDLRAGELRLLAAGIVLAVASVTSVAFFTDRVGRALHGEAAQLLGADLLLSADHPWTPSYAMEAERRGLQVAQTVTFPSMAVAAGGVQLVEVKAVSDGYPLRGSLRWAAERNAPEQLAPGVPGAGEAWIDARLADVLRLRRGDLFELGRLRLRAAGIVTLEPDRGANFFALAPRVLIHVDDLAATGLLQTGSRVAYRLLLAGTPDQVAAFRTWSEPQLGRGERMEGLDNARPELRRALRRAESYLGLTALLAAVLAAVTVAMAARRFNARHMDGCAVMRCLGATQARLAGLFLLEFLLLGALASALGCMVGYAGHYAIASWMASLVSAELPAVSWLPLVQGFVTGVLLLLGFAMPPILRLRKVPAIRVLRREWNTLEPLTAGSYAAGLAVLGVLLFWQAGDAKLGAWVLLGLAVALVVFSLAGHSAITLLGRLRGRATGAWRLACASLVRRRAGGTVQIVALALGLSALLLLTVTRGDLLEAWRKTAPPGQPNRYLVGVQPEQTQRLGEWFARRGLPVPELNPLVRARLISINERQLSSESYADPRSQRLADREFNLSWAERLAPDNEVVAGRWFTAADRGQAVLSVETWIAETLGIAVGDILTYEAAGQRFSAKVIGLRKLEWESMRANFYVVAPPGLLERYPTSYMSAFYVAPEHSAAVGELVREFPNVTMIDIASVLTQVQAMMDKVIQAVEFVFLFALAAGILVLYAALYATQDERIVEAAVLRVVGARRAMLMRMHGIEYGLLGALSGFAAALAATAIALVLYRKVFELEYSINPWVWLIGPLAGVAAVALAGWAAARRTVSAPPLPVLRGEG